MKPPNRIVGPESTHISSIIQLVNLTIFISDILVPIWSAHIVRIKMDLNNSLATGGLFNSLERDSSACRRLRKLLKSKFTQKLTSNLEA